MSVSSRSPSAVALESGELVAVTAANLTASYASSRLMSSDPTKDRSPLFRIHPRSTAGREGGSGPAGWGVGVRALHLTTVTPGRSPGVPVPVLALRPGGAGSPARVTLLQGAVDPVLVRHPISQRLTLLYWVNGWSPPGTEDAGLPESLFSSVRPHVPRQVDDDYLHDTGYTGPQPGNDYTEIRDVPSWYRNGQAPAPEAIPGSPTERVGPLDLRRFWVAPFTDAHLYRFPSDTDPFPAPPKQPVASPPVPPSPPSPPSPPGVVSDPSSDLIQRLTYLSTPQNDTTRAVSAVLRKIRDRETLTLLENETLREYRYCLARWAGLSRCQRVLLRAEGSLYQGRRQADGSTDLDAEATYLVVQPPRPILGLSRGINKVTLGRPKLTTYLGADAFITAALTYRYPAAATVSLCSGNPQVDFTVYSPSDRFDELRRPGILPESTDPQRSQGVAGSNIVIPSRYGSSLVEVLSNMSVW